MKSLALLRQAAADPRLALMLALGYSSGLPFLLIFSTQSAWLREAGVSKADIGLMSYCALAFSFKFLWAPVIDRFDPPGLGAAGSGGGGLDADRAARRRGRARRPRLRRPRRGRWPGASASPRSPPSPAATQDVTIDGWRIDAAPPERQGMMTAVYSLGYRLAMICAGAGALYLADFGGWRVAYLVDGGADAGRHGRLPAVAAARPRRARAAADVPRPRSSSRWPTSFAAMPAMIVPILLLVALYRLPDFVSGVMANPLYIDLGFTKSDIATVSKLYGVWIGIAGAFAGGWLARPHRPDADAADRRRRRLRLASVAGLSRRPSRPARSADARRQRREFRQRLRRGGADRLHVVAGLAGLCGDAICAAVLALRAARQVRRRRSPASWSRRWAIPASSRRRR